MQAYALRDSAVVVLEQERPQPGRTYVLKIRDLPGDDKPREKLIKYGPENLSVHELLAVIINTGTVKEDVLNMASRVVKEYGERALSVQKNAASLARDLDIPLVKAAQIVAVGELGRRFYERKATGPALLRTAKDVYRYAAEMARLPKEHLRGIYLNSHHRVIHDEVISIGTINANLIHPREVFKPAIEYGAAAVILVHNHPSGVVKPSQADIDVTRQLVAVGNMVGIHLVDHIIVGAGKFSSIEVDYG
ncbi:MAG: replication and repair protein RadC protein [Candidatus Magasanikbacteria bacterium GW2011_GWA2_56_11]|uniref:Replication and repair protein RadC protein n=1 Tax=Candidatus Magasanikbacteria bacterium GW2011_GWA2_56_11 TaxID=1619044 RepID=A0A0G1YGB0_9BACT|nr:MAG: replication and repair protein RadC protein [Candidatus Magasanikbacteria bacterium GW2011_GWA2_56_11]